MKAFKIYSFIQVLTHIYSYKYISLSIRVICSSSHISFGLFLARHQFFPPSRVLERAEWNQISRLGHKENKGFSGLDYKRVAKYICQLLNFHEIEH